MLNEASPGADLQNGNIRVPGQSGKGPRFIFKTSVGQGFIFIGNEDIHILFDNVVENGLGLFNHGKTGQIQRNQSAGRFSGLKGSQHQIGIEQHITLYVGHRAVSKTIRCDLFRPGICRRPQVG